LGVVRIAIVSTPFIAVPPPRYGGTELVVHTLARTLAGWGHEVAVFATGDSDAPGLRALVREAVWPPEPYVEVAHGRFAAAEIARGRFDVAHLHAPAALAFADALGVPAVYTLHHPRDPTLARYYRLVPHVPRVAISRRQADLEHPRPEHVVHHGLDPGLYPDADPDRTGGYAAFLGRLSWVKGPELAIEAARRAGLDIVVAGAIHDDGGPPGWKEQVLEPALAERHVRWLREADVAAKRRLFAGARALLVPIRWEEPFGLVMIEAMLAGCPVVAFPCGAAPEIVEEGLTGHLVDGVVGMAAALRTLRRFDRARCQARARERFSGARMAREYLDVYRAALRAGAPVGGGEERWRTLAW
jgi:glycosyltransferase involved in cell wall biosynthesis